MRLVPRHTVVLGAPGTGAAELVQQLRPWLAAHPQMVLSDAPQPSQEHDFALLMGLDQPATDAAPPSERRAHDARLRDQLQAHHLPFRVVYGAGPTRLHNALLALGLPTPDQDARQAREQAQFELNRGRTLWSCDKCSDPDCEHRLFTGLLGRS